MKVLIGSKEIGFLKKIRIDICQIMDVDKALREILCFESEEVLLFHIEEAQPLPLILLLDIEESGVCGIEVVKKIKEINKFAQIIFVSEKGKFYKEVYEVEHVYFLEKPIELECLGKALYMAKKRVQMIEEEVFPIVTKRSVYNLKIHDIEYFEKEKRLIHVYVDGEKHTYYGKFDDLHRFNLFGFYRCHNSYVINFRYVNRLEEQSFYMNKGNKIPISRHKLKEAKSMYIDFSNRFI